MRDSAGGGHEAGAWYLVESRDASEDDVGVLHLDDALAQPQQVRADPDGTAGHLGTHTRTPVWGGYWGGRAAAEASGTGVRCSAGVCTARLRQVLCCILLFSQGDLKARRRGEERSRGRAHGCTMLMVTISSYAREDSPATVPAALRFSTPSPSSFPMMSRRTYLWAKQSHGGVGRTGGSTRLPDASGRMGELCPGRDVSGASGGSV